MGSPFTRAASRAISIGVITVLVVVTAWWPALGGGVVVGAVGGAIVLMAMLRWMEWLDDRDRLPAVSFAVGATATVVMLVAVPAALAWWLLGTVGAIAAATTSAVLVVGFLGRFELQRVRQRWQFRRLEQVLVAGGDPAPILALLPATFVFGAAERLAHHQRFAELVTYLENLRNEHAHERLLVDWRVAALLALGDAAAARRTFAAATAPVEAFDREMAALQDARIRIAEGDAAGIVAELGEDAPASGGPALALARAAIRADARAATGDEAGARAILDALVPRHGVGMVEQLARQRRPSSDLAAEVAAARRRADAS